mgnify:FL=1|tara:strand:+ start:108 stop:740 length:633 start_codon:yes stop_codon:yes gene_type:complete
MSINWSFAQDQSAYQVAVLKYKGGGDWYSNPTALPNLMKFCNKNLGTSISTVVATVDISDPEIFNYPFVHMTGHGNVVFTIEDAENLRNYLLGGGFLHVDDNYGMDQFIRTELKKVFPAIDLVELPNNHPIFNQTYKFPKGLPKIHEHDDKNSQAFGIVYQGRLICLYTYETDLGDGWEDPEVHGDSPEKRSEALRMGANIIEYVFTAVH